MHDGLLQEHAGVVYQVAGWKVVTAVHDQVVVLEDLDDVLAGQPRLIRDHFDIRVQVLERLLRRIDLRLPDPLAVVQDLPLQVALVDHVGVDDPERADPGGRQVVGGGRSQAAGPDDEHFGIEQLQLPLLPHLGNQHVRFCCAGVRSRGTTNLKPASFQAPKPPFNEATRWKPICWRVSAAKAERLPEAQ